MLSIAVLAGGESHERAVSLASGRRVAEALRSVGHQTELFDTAQVDLARIAWSRYDACFIALHGGAGEDGRIQRRLELLKVPYTGSGPAASRLAMSKSASKERFRQARVPTLPYVLLHASDGEANIATRAESLGYPMAVKPDSQGSSLGVGRANSRDELGPRIAAAATYEEFVIVEPWIEGREFTVSILGRQPLPTIEIESNGFYDFAAKYGGRATRRTFELSLSRRQAEEVARLAVAAADSVGACGLSRVDLLVDGDGQPHVLEVNTIPGMTEHSLAPLAAAEVGLDLPGLCDWMVRDCQVAGAAR